MALADICGFGQQLAQRNDNKPSLFQDDMINCGNFENNYQLAMPPFANVRL